MPGIEQVLHSLLGELQENGLIRENDTAPAGIRQLGEELNTAAIVRVFKMRLKNTLEPITLPESLGGLLEPSWSPTELGEQILAFYAEAGSEDR